MLHNVQLLPSALVGLTILPLLTYRDYARLDSALGSTLDRRWLESVLLMFAPVNVYYCSDPRVWGWFWKRNIGLRRIFLACSDDRNLNAVLEAIANVNLIASDAFLWISGSRCIAAVDELLWKSPDLAKKIHSMKLHGRKHDLITFPSCTALAHLWSMECDAADFNPKSRIEEALHQNARLDTVKIECGHSLDRTFYSALAKRGNSLTTLDLSIRALTAANRAVLGTHCTVLQTLSLSVIGNLIEGVVDDPLKEGVKAIVRSNSRTLRTITLYGPQFADCLSGIAQYGHALRSIWATYKALDLLTGDVLALLHTNCVHLYALDKVSGAFTTTSAQVHCAVFDRLLCLSLHIGDLSMGTLEVVMKHMRNMSMLKLCGARVSAAALANLAANSGQLSKIRVRVAVEERAQAAAVALVRANPMLKCIGLRHGVLLYDSLLVALALHCPELRVIDVSAPTRGQTDVAVTLLAHGCPHLKILKGLGGAALTDDSFLAMSDYCRQLSSLDLRKVVIQHYGLIVSFMRRCPKLRDIAFIARTPAHMVCALNFGLNTEKIGAVVKQLGNSNTVKVTRSEDPTIFDTMDMKSSVFDDAFSAQCFEDMEHKRITRVAAVESALEAAAPGVNNVEDLLRMGRTAPFEKEQMVVEVVASVAASTAWCDGTTERDVDDVVVADADNGDLNQSLEIGETSDGGGVSSSDNDSDSNGDGDGESASSGSESVDGDGESSGGSGSDSSGSGANSMGSVSISSDDDMMSSDSDSSGGDLSSDTDGSSDSSDDSVTESSSDDSDSSVSSDDSDSSVSSDEAEADSDAGWSDVEFVSVY